MSVACSLNYIISCQKIYVTGRVPPDVQRYTVDKAQMPDRMSCQKYYLYENYKSSADWLSSGPSSHGMPYIIPADKTLYIVQDSYVKNRVNPPQIATEIIPLPKGS